MEQSMKVIKYVGTLRFDLGLIQYDDGMYAVEYQNGPAAGVEVSEKINQFDTASYLFDLKLRELEGN